MRTAIIAIIICFCMTAFAIPDILKVPSQYSTIQDAIQAAVNGDTVVVAPGIYMENLDFMGKNITVRSESGPKVTFIDGGQKDSVVIFMNGETLDAVLDGFTLTNGSGHLFTGTTRGGGVCIIGASPTVMNNVITKNTATYGGAGIFLDAGSCAKILNNTVFQNSAVEYGGGIKTDYSSPEIIGNKVFENTADLAAGGVLCGGGSPTVKNNIVTGNTSGLGGGMFLWITSATIENNVVTNNSADRGGGIDISTNCTGTVANNTIAWNTANNPSDGGGGMALKSNCSMVISNNLICGNKGIKGGGIDVDMSSQAIIRNNTIHGNRASNSGGGVACRGKSTALIVDTILWANEAPSGPGIFIGAPTTPSTVTISYTDLEGGQASVANNGGTLNWGSGMIDMDPLYAAGPSGFFYLGQTAAGQPADSPCVDAGSDLASNLGMDLCWTRTDGICDSGTVDMGYHYGDFLFPSLQADTFTIPESTGGESAFLLLAGAENANRTYLLLGSITGTDPGTPLPGGQVVLPLNWDLFTALVIGLLNTPVFSNFMGKLDGTGSATATFDTLGPITGVQGLTLHFAYAMNNPWDFVSNPVGIKIVP